MFRLLSVMIEVIRGSKELFSGFLEEIRDAIGCVVTCIIFKIPIGI